VEGDSKDAQDRDSAYEPSIPRQRTIVAYGVTDDGQHGQPDERRGQGPPDDDWIKTTRCFRCGKVGHLRDQCPDKPAQTEAKGKGSRPAKSQRRGGKPSRDYYGPRDRETKVMFAEADEYDSVEDVSNLVVLCKEIRDDDEDSVAEALVDVNYTISRSSRTDELLLDSGASRHIVCNAKLLANVRQSSTRYRITGVEGKPVYASTIGELATLGTAILVEEFDRNLVSLGQLSWGKWRRTLSSSTESVSP
jgi:hypothetical protein